MGWREGAGQCRRRAHGPHKRSAALRASTPPPLHGSTTKSRPPTSPLPPHPPPHPSSPRTHTRSGRTDERQRLASPSPPAHLGWRELAAASGHEAPAGLLEVEPQEVHDDIPGGPACTSVPTVPTVPTVNSAHSPVWGCVGVCVWGGSGSGMAAAVAVVRCLPALPPQPSPPPHTRTASPPRPPGPWCSPPACTLTTCSLSRSLSSVWYSCRTVVCAWARRSILRARCGTRVGTAAAAAGGRGGRATGGGCLVATGILCTAK